MVLVQEKQRHELHFPNTFVIFRLKFEKGHMEITQEIETE